MKKPLIGITMDSEDGHPQAYSKFDWYALRENYAGSIEKAGGLPLALPHEPDLAEEYLNLIDGLLITGGAFDVDPSFYGDQNVHETVVTKDRRTRFEWAMTKGAFDRDIPILGICGGQQLLHVILGGKLVQHIPDHYPQSTIAHEQPNPRNEAGHSVQIEKDTLLYEIVQTEELSVNSAHHQSILDEPTGTKINARSQDGVLEGIEFPDKKFCLGVQWHPEFHISSGDHKIIEAFVKAAGS